MAAKLNCTIAFLMLAVASGAPASAQEATTSAAEKFLQKAGIGTDDASLVAFLHKLSAGDADPEQIDRLIRNFGSSDFTEREQAYRKVVGIGLRAVDRLRRAEQDTDSEIRQRAKQAIVEIERNGPPPEAPAVVIRLLLQRQSPGTVEALVHFLPFAPDEETAEPIWFGLEAWSRQQGKIPNPIVDALKDPLPARRALAGCLVGSLGTAEQRAAARPLLEDAEAVVRLRTAQGLLAGKDKAGIPVLMALLEGSPLELAWQAEELLRWVAGEQSPEPLIGAGSTEARKQCRQAWEAWWRQHGGGVDVAQVMKTVRRPGLYLVLAVSPEPMGNPRERAMVYRFFVCGWDGKPRYTWGKPIHGASIGDFQYLPGNRLLIAEGRPLGPFAKPGPGFVRERDADGRVVWEFEAERWVARCRRLPGGKTLILTGASAQPPMIFVARHSKAVEAWDPEKHSHFFARMDMNPLLYQCRYEADLHNGNRLYLDSSRLMERNDIYRLVGEVLLRKSLLGESSSFRARPMLQLVGLGFAKDGLLDPAVWLAHRIAGLKSKDPQVREVSIQELANFGPKAIGAVPDLIEALDDPDRRLRFDACLAFVHLGPEAIPVLLTATKDKRPKVRAGALTALSQYRQEVQEIAPLIIAMLQEDRDPEVRQRAAYALGRVGATVEGVLPALAKALKDREESPDKLGSVAWAAASALANIGKEAKPVLPAVVEALKDDNERVVDRVIGCLRQIGPGAEPAVPALAEMLLNNKIKPGLRTAVARALASIGPPHAKLAIPALRQALNDPDDQIRAEAKKTLAIIDP